MYLACDVQHHVEVMASQPREVSALHVTCLCEHMDDDDDDAGDDDVG
jgi:hypothetical protein